MGRPAGERGRPVSSSTGTNLETLAVAPAGFTSAPSRRRMRQSPPTHGVTLDDARDIDEVGFVHADEAFGVELGFGKALSESGSPVSPPTCRTA